MTDYRADMKRYKFICIEIIRYSFALICFIGFVYLIKDQVRKYFDAETGIKQVTQSNRNLKLPVLVFCPKNPYIRPVFVNQSFEEYRSNLNLSMKVEFLGKSLDDYISEPVEQFEQEPLYTLFHGVCQQFRVTKSVLVSDYYLFLVQNVEEFLLYLLRPGEEPFLIFDYFIRSIPLIQSAEPLVLTLSQSSYVTLGQKYPCSHYTYEDLQRCMKKSLNNQILVKKNITCSSFFFDNLLQEPFPACNSTSESFRSYHKLLQYVNVSLYQYSQDEMNSHPNEEWVCFRPCRTVTYNYYKGPLNLKHKDNAIAVYVSYWTAFEDIQEEYLLYDFGAIVAAVGGALGLFLGISFFGIGSQFLDYVSKQK